MKILAFAGFLGSGKTTVIKSCITTMIKSGLKVAIIENEIGATSIDDKILQDADIEMTTLTGGCVCCSISGSLIVAARKIEEQVNPDWLIVELTGLAYMSGIKALFKDYADQYPLYSATVVDISRWLKLLKITKPLLADQVSCANAVVVNKVDVYTPTEDDLATISELTEAPIILTSAQSAGKELWEEICSKIGC